MIDKFGRTELGRYFYDPSSSSGITGDLYIRTNGNSTITSDLDFKSHKIINLGESISSHDAATKNYVDTHSSGGTISIITSDLDLNSHKLIHVNEPTSLQDAATKNCVDISTSLCVKTDRSSTISGNINLNTHKIINMTDPTNSQDVATKNYVDNNSQKSTYLGIDANSSFSSLGLKSQILPVGLSDASTIFSYSDGPGILRRL